jgi:hypothetical protein
MSVAGDLTHRVVEKSDLHDAWESGQSLQILPLRNVVIVQVQKLQTLQSIKHLSLRQFIKLVIAKVYFLQVGEGVEVS